ncbi:hypothetical protein NVV94_08385 [Pseudomonas sp. LS1212]|uniref:hypothetical protein n=1 Tax=Pseudomonas sp. LS1212 TaxID=2972478 RepID=UPI00215B7ECB|nr:hypothetical protein [Pseudomonas sp. LS1212]UVJ45560.1 hypothetical protein NVV94_08385 [Pseudomonas sp. LS1212]
MDRTLWSLRGHTFLEKRQWVMSGSLLLFAIAIIPDITMAGDKVVPNRPFNETVENCKAYKDEAYQALHDQFQKELSCISSTRANISKGEECNDLTGRVHKGIIAWPHCQDAEYHCALVRASEDATQCMKQAKSQEGLGSPKTDKMLSDVIKADTLASEIKEDYHVLRDPIGYLNDKVVEHLTEANKHAFINSVFNEDGKLNPYGVKVTDQFYNWGFKKMTLDSRLMSNNPIIQAIQSESFTALGNMQQQMLGEIQDLRNSIKNMEMHYPQPAPPTKTFNQASTPSKPVISKTTAPSSPECAILSNGEEASNLSIDHPEKFAALIQKCGG